MSADADREIALVADALREPVRASADFDARVMAAVAAMPRHRPSRWTRWMSPRVVHVRPLHSALAASVLLVAALFIGRAVGVADGDRATTPTAPTAHPSASAQAVEFMLVAPTATKVAVVGDFNDWNVTHAGYQARHRGGGVWSVTAAVPSGHHRYAFVVNDSLWMADPAALRAADEDFGKPSSMLVVNEEGK